MDGYRKFSIDRYTGVISTSASLDREQRSEYLLVVMATDRGLVRQSSTAQVRVRVEDVNDHAPQFQQRSYVAQIRDGILPGRYAIVQLLFSTCCRIAICLKLYYSQYSSTWLLYIVSL